MATAERTRTRARAALATSQWAPTVELVGLAGLVTAQVLVNYHGAQISDLRHLYFAHRLYLHPLPYRDVRIEYPVLTGVYMTAAAALTHSARGYLELSSAGLWACAVACVCVLRSLSRRAAWCFALCPLLLVYSLLNWDLLAILLMLLGWRAFTRERHVAAGAWLALGTFAKLYPGLLLVLCAVALARRWRRQQTGGRDLRHLLCVAAVVSVAVNAPFALLAWPNWTWFWSFNAVRDEHAGLLSWLGLLHHASPATTDIVLAAVALAVITVAVLAVWCAAPVAQIAALAFFALMLVQKVYSPQYTLWLVVFALLAEWEPWTIGMLSIIGLVDYANAITHIALIAHHDLFVHWYERHIYGLERSLRLATTLAVAAAMAGRRARPQLQPPVVDRLETPS